MYARLTTLKGSPDKYEEAAQQVREAVLPTAKGQPGFVAGYWGLSRETGDGFALSVWEDEASVKASESVAATLREGVTQSVGANITSVTTFEIIAQA